MGYRGASAAAEWLRRQVLVGRQGQRDLDRVLARYHEILATAESGRLGDIAMERATGFQSCLAEMNEWLIALARMEANWNRH